MRAAIEQQLAAVRIQRESVRKQMQDLRIAPVEATSEPACEPLPPTEISPIIESAATSNQLEPELVRAVMRQESAFYPCAVSSKGAKGLMQLMPATIEQFAVHDPFDAKESVETGAKYLKQLLDRYQANLSLALAAYNAGPATVDEAKGVPDIAETRAYVDAILKALKAPITPPDPPRDPTPKPIGN